MAKVIIEMAHPSEYILDMFKYAIDNKIKTINFAEDELEYICEQIKGYHEGYEQGKKDRDKEISEHSVFYSSKPIEDIVLEARADERANVIDLIDRHLWNYSNEVWEDFQPILGKLKEQK